MTAEPVGRIAALRSSPVKGLMQDDPEELVLDREGARADRRFAVVGASGLALFTAQLRPLAGTRARWDETTDRLTLHFADGETVEGAAAGDRSVRAHGYARRPMPGLEVAGPFAAILSERLGRPVRLVRLAVGVGAPGALTLLSQGSLRRLASELGVDVVDARRFKMTMELDGPEAHGEDRWRGRELVVGEVRLRVGEPVGRCVLTTLEPATLRRDLDTLRTLLSYRGALPSGEPGFGVYATVVEPGRVRVGDPVSLAG